uniref:Big-1 domain-containing protein n=1 Tax=Kuenenia stuttgartiensis TaxID=174633 RepID=Q1PYU4_KUEST|nr:protein with unknown function [Candidatus Kuenenia stuttgartiensis]
MKRPGLNLKGNWLSMAGVLFLMLALVMGVASNAKAATGSFDRDRYLPEKAGGNDYDRAWISVTDSSGNTTSSPDTITVTVRAGVDDATSFILLETGNTSTVFTTTGTVQPNYRALGTTSGYVEDLAGSYWYSVLGNSIVGLDLRLNAANIGGNAQSATSGDLKVAEGSTLELLYGGSTLDTATVGFNSGSISSSPSSVTSVEGLPSNGNIILSISDPDENLNPVVRDVIGFYDGFTTGDTRGTASSMVQISAVDQSSDTGDTLSLGGTSIVARHIMLVETGNNTGVFTASGYVYGTTTTVAASDLVGNLKVGSSSESYYQGQDITLGAGTVSCTFRIVEANANGGIALIYNGTSTETYGTVSVVFDATSAPRADVGASLVAFGTSSLSLGDTQTGHKVVCYGTQTSTGYAVSAWGLPSSSSNYAATGSKLVKLMDGSSYCLIAVSSFSTPNVSAGLGTEGDIIANSGYGSVSVVFDGFRLVGPRDGDTLKVSYLDLLKSNGQAGTVSANISFGIAGKTGELSVDKTTVDINDFLTVTVIDDNLNTSSSTSQSVGEDSWNGTTTAERGDRLKVAAYSSGSGEGVGNALSLSFKDGTSVGTSSAIRVSNTDNSLVWIIPKDPSSGYIGTPGTRSSSAGSATFTLGTQSVDTNALMKGASSAAKSFLSSATTSSFVATLDGLGDTVEISPDGTRWIAIPVTETGANSATFVGTVGFDYTAARVTTDTTLTRTTAFSDSTDYTTITFANSEFNSTNRLDSFIGTGSVVRVRDDFSQEFQEVVSVAGSTMVVTKLASSTSFTPYKTWIQVIGNDMTTAREDTLSNGAKVFRIGGFFGATYRIRYNDAKDADGNYKAGDTLAATASDVGFQTYDGELSTNVSGTIGPNQYVVVTLVDEDLNTSTSSKQTTSEPDRTESGTRYVTFYNENGLGNPVGSSTSNAPDGLFKNGFTAKVLYASKLSNVLSSSVDQSSNTIDFKLEETAVNSGTFKGSFQLSSSSSTLNSSDRLQVSSGDSIYVHYNDSPSATAEDNSTNYRVVGPLSIETSIGSLLLSKAKAYLSGDTVVVSVVDDDQNTTSGQDTLTDKLKIEGSNYSTGGALTLDLVESGNTSGTFLATFTTGTETVETSANLGKVKAQEGGVVTVTYTDSSPSNTTVTETLSFGSYDATIEFNADSYGLGTYAIVTLADAERNTSHTGTETLLDDVFIQTSSVNSTKMRLVETGNDTGTFVGSILVTSSGATTEFNQIQGAEGETLTVTYSDTINTTSSTRTVTDTAAITAAVTPSPTPTPGVTPTPGITPTPGLTPTPSLIPGLGSVEGFVTDAATGDGIEGATVRNQSGIYTDTTDADGFYSIANVEAGTRTFTAVALGYVPSAPTAIVVTAGGTTNLDFALVASVQGTPITTPTVTPPPTATLVVAVADGDGIPIAGATVTVDGQSGVTDASGGATFTLEAGDYEVSVSATDYLTSVVTVTVTPPVTILPVTLEPKGPCPEPDEAVASAATVTPDSLSLTKGDSEDVIVLVTDEDGCPAQGVKVKRKLTSANKKKIKVTPASETTDTSGQATFTVKAKKSKGKANVKFAVKGVKDKPKVNVTLAK